MSSTSLMRIAERLPVRWWDRRRLKQVLREARAKKYKFAFSDLVEMAYPIAPELLSMVLSLLVEQGLVKRKFQVISGGVGLDKVDSIEEIPPKVYNDVAGEWVDVTRDKVHVVYEFE